MLNEKIWGDCASLPEEDQKKLLDQDNLPFGAVSKIIKKAYPEHGLGDKNKYLAKFSRKIEGYEEGTMEIEARSEEEATKIAKDCEDDDIDWDRDYTITDCDSYEFEEIEEIRGVGKSTQLLEGLFY